MHLKLLLLDEGLLTGAAFIWKAALMFIHMIEHRTLILLDVAAKGADVVAMFILDICACRHFSVLPGLGG